MRLNTAVTMSLVTIRAHWSYARAIVVGEWFALSLLATGCGEASHDAIRIGGAGWFSSPTVTAADNLVGIQIAVDEANAAGGVLGRRLELVVADDHGVGTDAARVAEQFVNDPSIVAVVGHSISQAMLGAVSIYDGHLAAVGSTTTAPGLTNVSHWFFRAARSDAALGAQLAGFAIAQHWNRIAILYENDDYGRMLARSFRSRAEHLGGTVVSNDSFIDGDSDLTIFAQMYARLQPDVIVVICTDGSARAFLQAAVAHHLKSHIIGADGWTASLATTPSADGVFIPSAFLPDDNRPRAEYYRERFRARYGREPDAVSALAYDAARAVIAAIAQGGATRQGVQRALASKEFVVDGASGAVRFKDGDRVGSGGGLVQVRDGKFNTYLRWPDEP